MKYIIDVPSECYINGEHFRIPVWSAEDVKDYMDTGLTVKPYIALDKKSIENEAWELASKLIWTFTERECKQIFGMEAAYVPRDMPYSEAKSKYDAWKKQREDEATMKEVTALAEKIGIHKLYSIVKEIRGE